jgi:hypothetical protein
MRQIQAFFSAAFVPAVVARFPATGQVLDAAR